MFVGQLSLAGSTGTTAGSVVDEILTYQLGLPKGRSKSVMVVP